MKHLFLYAIAFLFLCTACFEKEEEIKVEEEIEVAPPEVDILECEIIQRFIVAMTSQPIVEPRPTIKKYLKGNEYVFETHTGGSSFFAIAYRKPSCEIICGMSGGIVGNNSCANSFLDSLVYVETVWIDQR